MKEELKSLKIEKFSGKTNLEGLKHWLRSAVHYAHLAGCLDKEVIEKAWYFLTLKALYWFKTMLRKDFGPFDWAGMKTKMTKVYSSFAPHYVWSDLVKLKRGREIAA